MNLKARDDARIRESIRRAVAFGPVYDGDAARIRAGGQYPSHPSCWLTHRRGPWGRPFVKKATIEAEKVGPEKSTPRTFPVGRA